MYPGGGALFGNGALNPGGGELLGFVCDVDATGDGARGTGGGGTLNPSLSILIGEPSGEASRCCNKAKLECRRLALRLRQHPPVANKSYQFQLQLTAMKLHTQLQDIAYMDAYSQASEYGLGLVNLAYDWLEAELQIVRG